MLFAVLFSKIFSKIFSEILLIFFIYFKTSILFSSTLET
jgi:hypothetical protein